MRASIFKQFSTYLLQTVKSASLVDLSPARQKYAIPNEYLLIRFHVNSDQITWSICHANGTMVTEPQHSTLGALNVATLPNFVIILIPGQQCHITELTLPQVSKRHKKQIIAYAFEDMLLADIDQYHFAVGASTPNQPANIIVIKHETLKCYIDSLAKINIQPDICLPENLLLPTKSNSISILTEDHQAIVRTNSSTGFSCDHSQLPWRIKSVMHEYNAPLKIYLFNTGNHTLQLAPSTIEQTNIAEPLQLFNQTLVEQGISNNILQGTWQIRKPFTLGLSKLWRLSAYILAIGISITFLSNMGLLWYVKHQKNLLETKIAGVYRSIFPEATSIVSPKIRFERELADLHAKQLGGSFFALASKLGIVMQKIPNIDIQSLDFREQKLAMVFEVANFQQLKNIKHELVNAGLVVTQQDVTTHGKKILAKLILG